MRYKIYVFYLDAETSSDGVDKFLNIRNPEIDEHGNLHIENGQFEKVSVYAKGIWKRFYLEQEKPVDEFWVHIDKNQEQKWITYEDGYSEPIGQFRTLGKGLSK